MLHIKQTYPFSLIPLPYDYNSLEPFIDTETMYYHHQKHLLNYVNTLNKLLQRYPEYHHMTLEELLTINSSMPYSIRNDVKNNAGGVFNHNLYFCSLKPQDTNYNERHKECPTIAAPSCYVQKLPIFSAINKTYGSYYNFKDLLKEAALKQFGSGYAWLTLTSNHELVIIQTNNQDTPFLFALMPLLLIDVWEHAYYLKHRNERIAYIEDWFHLIDWDVVNYRYISNIKKC